MARKFLRPGDLIQVRHAGIDLVETDRLFLRARRDADDMLRDVRDALDDAAQFVPGPADEVDALGYLRA